MYHLFTTGEVARIVRQSTKTIINRIEAGALLALRPVRSRDYRITPAALRAYLGLGPDEEIPLPDDLLLPLEAPE